MDEHSTRNEKGILRVILDRQSAFATIEIINATARITATVNFHITATLRGTFVIDENGDGMDSSFQGFEQFMNFALPQHYRMNGA